jgi:hypothetical protein
VVRDARRQLSRLNETEMKRIAVEAGATFARLPTDQRLQIVQALQIGVPGMPHALGEQLLAEFRGNASAR